VRKILYFLVILAAGFFLLAFFAWQRYSAVLNAPLAISEDYHLTVAAGQGLSNVAQHLKADGLIDRVEWLKILARRQGNADQIKAGQYQFPPGTTLQQLYDMLIEGKVVLEQITVPEGYTFRQMLAVIHAKPTITATLKNKSDKEIMRILGLDGQHPEGQFLPETYRFAAGTEDLAILRQALAAMQSVLQQAWAQKSADSELQSAYEALILASIIEKETGVFDEQATIAGVFNARLKKGMRLQTDPTVIYGMGSAYNGNIRKKDLQTDTPYNTYTRSGLPPTPIALPGKNAIYAAVNPEKHNKLYFVATGKGDGRHYFSATLEEHNQAVQRYLRRYRQNQNN